jgi:hypothetical protein
MRFRSKLYSLAILALLGSNVAAAAPDEIQVYTDEISKPGQYGMELHLNHSMSSIQMPSYPGQMSPQHATQATPEFFYGLTPTMEAGMYVPLAWNNQGNSYLNGLRLRLKYIAPHEPEAFFWGLNGEVGQFSIRTSQSAEVAELRPIIGYRDHGWLASFNPVLNMGLSANVSHLPYFEPSLKLTHSVTQDMSAGAEYYGEYGPLTQFVPANQRSHTLYGVIDMAHSGYDLNFGLGRGYVNASDRWVMKAIVTIPFN